MNDVDGELNIKVLMDINSNIKIKHNNNNIINYSIVQLFLDNAKRIINGHNTGEILLVQVKELKDEVESLSNMMDNLYNFLSSDIDKFLKKIEKENNKYNMDPCSYIDTNLTFENFLEYHISNISKKFKNKYAIIKLKNKTIINIYDSYNDFYKTLIKLVNKKLKYVNIKIDNNISFNNLIKTFNEMFENNLLLLKIDHTGKGYKLSDEKENISKKSR